MTTPIQFATKGLVASTDDNILVSFSEPSGAIPDGEIVNVEVCRLIMRNMTLRAVADLLAAKVRELDGAEKLARAAAEFRSFAKRQANIDEDKDDSLRTIALECRTRATALK